jgi:hypothetical protein
MRKLVGGSASIVALAKNAKYAKILGMYVELISSQTGDAKARSESIFDSAFVDACLSSMDHCVNSNLFLQLFLLNSGLRIRMIVATGGLKALQKFYNSKIFRSLNSRVDVLKFSFFVHLLSSNLDNSRKTAMLLDTFRVHIESLKAYPCVLDSLVASIDSHMTSFHTSKLQNMVVSILVDCGTRPSFDLLFRQLAIAECSKVKFRTIAAINKNVSDGFWPSIDQIETVYSSYFGADGDVKDSVLDFFVKLVRTNKAKMTVDAVEKFISIVEKCLEDEMGVVRANAIKAD